MSIEVKIEVKAAKENLTLAAQLQAVEKEPGGENRWSPGYVILSWVTSEVSAVKCTL